MILSMTGYGRSESRLRGKKIVCEIRSLNSKNAEISVRMPYYLRAREIDLRAQVTKRVERGKVDVTITEEMVPNEGTGVEITPVNWLAAKEYAHQYEQHFGGTVPPEVMAAIMRFPDVTKSQDEATDITDEEWQVVQKLLENALDAFIAFRTQEGAALQVMFTSKLDEMTSLLAQVETFEKSRVPKIRERLEQNLAQLAADTQAQIDRNRLEQEMIYYLEKLDITEEKVRLTNHIRYFRETMDGNGAGVGKKLGFIAQEMGREINTLGSKSNQSEMQIIVVKMKDLLEQIKEQVLNVL